MKPIRHRSVRAIGEAMVEMAPLGNGLYRRGFAGDTYNTVWHMARLLEGRANVGMVTRVGQDSLSDAFVAGMAADGMAVSGVSRDPSRRLGLYMIELDGVERSFHYWRDTSAARHLAEDKVALLKAIDGVGLVHLSGITLAILSPDARETLFSVLADFRSKGGLVSFDPNIRPRLWASRADMLAAITRMLSGCDIALPSLDDERAHFGDADARAVIARMVSLGVAEVVVKDGAEQVLHFYGDRTLALPTPTLADIVDTTGAGDAFNAGYLAARVLAFDAADCVEAGQRMAAIVLAHHGALASKDAVAALGSAPWRQ
jgi:2-dehydro-3-deoxygluconokinase